MSAPLRYVETSDAVYDLSRVPPIVAVLVAAFRQVNAGVVVSGELRLRPSAAGVELLVIDADSHETVIGGFDLETLRVKP